VYSITYFNLIHSSKTRKKADIIAIQKPGKPGNDSLSYQLSVYHPISLLSSMSKLMERIILKRIEPTFEKAIFRPKNNCCDQVLAITSYVEKGYNINIKTCADDLSAAYDAVWNNGLLL